MSTVGTGEGERQHMCLDLPSPQQVTSECSAPRCCVTVSTSQCDSGGFSETGFRVWGEWFVLVHSLCSLQFRRSRGLPCPFLFFFNIYLFGFAGS